ncbi:MAG TPA: IPT/TIG domain-containing protein [Thermoanaerobaculia bacterium]|nr:IPT/TIG domain-containing protein [Thermoanaerobaculia bacterium]
MRIRLLASVLLLTFFSNAPMQAQNNELPIITTVSPSSGPLEGGSTVVIDGASLKSNCQITCPLTRVYFGTVEGRIVGDHASRIIVIAPPHAAGVVDIRIVLPNGSTAIRKAVFRYGQAGVEAQEFERILVPIASSDFPGAYESFWVTRLSVYNDNDRVVQENSELLFYSGIFPRGSSLLPSKKATILPPHALQAIRPSWQPGVIVYARKDVADGLHFSLRIRDTTRQATAYGTEIPVVRERELRTGPIILLNLPVGERYRQSLRIYEVDRSSNTCGRVQLRLFDMSSGETLASREIELTNYEGRPCTVAEYLDRHYPNGAQIHSLAQQLLPERGSREFVGLELRPLSVGLRYWAFVTIGDNETQHVSTITP